MIKKESGKIAGIILLALIVLSVNFSLVSAELKLLCLNKGQTLMFSECNPNMDDKTCSSDICQFCVDYSNGIYCPANPNNCNSAGISECESFEDNQIEEFPEITLVEPGSIRLEDEPLTIDFKFQVSQSYNISKCELVLNEEVVANNSVRIQSKTNTISYFVNYGSYSWRIDCKTKTGGMSVSSETRSLTIGQSNNDVLLVSPENNFAISGSQTINFVYNVSGDLANIKNCSLMLNDNIVASNVNISENINTISRSVDVGSYAWKIRCVDKIGNVDSNIRSFAINAVSSGGTGGNSGGGGGGGGGSTVKRKVTNSTSNQTLTNLTNVISNKTEELSINQSLNVDDEEARTSGGITGAVIGGVANNYLVIIGFVVVIVAGFAISSYFRKKEK